MKSTRPICPAWASFCCAVVLHAAAGAEESGKPDTPLVGNWRGFHAGDFIVERKTFHGAESGKDRAEYRKIVLLGASKFGAPGFYSYTSDSPGGPWKPGPTSWSETTDAREGVKVESKALPPENLEVGGRTFQCRSTFTTFTSDEGTKTRKEWIDEASGVVLRSEESFDGQNGTGKPWRWTLSRTTTGIEPVRIGGRELVCFVQEAVQSLGNSELRWNEAVSGSVPGRIVRSKYFSKRGGNAEVETAVVAWGHDVDLLDDFKRKMPELGIVSEDDIQNRRMAEESKRKQAVVDLEAKTLADLSASDAATRASAVNCLAGWPLTEATKPLAVEGLKKALDDPDAKVRRRAALGVGQLGVKKMSGPILELLRGDPEGAFDYLYALALQGESEGLPAILGYTSHANEHLRKAAATALGSFKSDEARLALEKALADPYWEVRHHAIEALERVGDARSVPALLKMLRDDNPLVVRKAIPLVSKLGNDDAVPAMLDLLQSHDEELRGEACIYLGQMKLKDPRPAGDALLDILNRSPSVQARTAAVSGLGKLREKRAVPQLVEIVRNPASFMQDRAAPGFFLPIGFAAMIALGEGGAPEGLTVLLKSLDDPGLHRAACAAFAAMGESGAKPLFEHFARSTDQSLRREELDVLGRIGTRGTIAELKSHLPNCPPSQKEAVRRAIQDIERRHEIKSKQ
jgi:HEAT repeat protein